MKNKIKNHKGFTTIDIVIGVIILTIFVPVISTLIYNIGMSTTETKRSAKAVNYATQYIEYAKMETSPINTEDLKSKIDLSAGYTANITANDSTGKVTVEIKYKVGNEEKSVILYVNI